jgi:hypothetical protein
VNRAIDLQAQLGALVQQLGDEELEVLCHVAQGLATGRKQYGPINPHDPGRDWAREALEEQRDAIVYVTCELIRNRNRR